MPVRCGLGQQKWRLSRATRPVQRRRHSRAGTQRMRTASGKRENAWSSWKNCMTNHQLQVCPRLTRWKQRSRLIAVWRAYRHWAPAGRCGSHRPSACASRFSRCSRFEGYISAVYVVSRARWRRTAILGIRRSALAPLVAMSDQPATTASGTGTRRAVGCKW